MEVVREDEDGWKDQYTGDLKLETANNMKDRKQTYREVVIPSVP